MGLMRFRGFFLGYVFGYGVLVVGDGLRVGLVDDSLPYLLAVLILLYLSCWLAEGIYKGVFISGSVLNKEIELGEEFSPSGLPCIQLLCHHKVF